MRKRFGFTTLAIMVVWLSIMPAMAIAAPGDAMKATGTGDARALDLDVLGLVRLTVAAADGKFELNTQGQGSATTSGRAVGICNLITGGSDPLACSAGNVATSSAPPDSGPAQSCLIPLINPGIISVEAACGKSESQVSGASPTGEHTASLAAIRVGLDTGLRNTLNGLVGTVEQTVDTTTGTVEDTVATVGELAPLVAGLLAAAPDVSGVTQVTDPVLAEVIKKLQELIASLENLAVIKVLPAEVHVSAPGTKTAKVEATSNVVDISLLDGLVHLQVTPSLANATYNGDAGKANCHAEAAVVRVKVKNILGGGELINLAPGQNLAGVLGGLGNGLVGIKVASATPDAVGDTCRAEARGLELNLLQLLNGGIALRVASTNAEIAGAVTPLALAAGPVCPDPKGCLPLTGGPTYLYMTAAFIMAAGALGAHRIYRKLNVSGS